MIENKFKKTEIGMIPEDWEECILGEVVIFKNGKSSPERNDYLIYPVYGSNGIIGFSDFFNSDAGTVIIGRVGSYCGSVYYSKNKCWVTDNAIIGLSKENTYSKFLYYLLSTLRLNDRRTGSGQPLLNQGILNSISVKIPKFSEQQSIAKILSSLDDKIELNHKMNKILEAIGQAVFKHWFIDFEFSNEEGKPYKSSGGEMVDSEFGNIPKGWEVGEIGNIIYERKEKVGKSKTKFTILSAVKTGELVFSDEYFDKKVYSENISKYKIVEKYDFAFNPARINIGSIGMLDKELLGAVSPIYVVFRPINNYQWFLNCFLLKDNTKSKIQQLCSGTVRQILSYKDFSSIELIIPPENIIQKFNKIYFKIKEMIDFNINQIKIISNIRDILLPKLMSGEIRVSLYVKKE
jgi:type I restriction enzyme S subunit